MVMDSDRCTNPNQLVRIVRFFFWEKFDLQRQSLSDKLLTFKSNEDFCDFFLRFICRASLIAPGYIALAL